MKRVERIDEFLSQHSDRLSSAGLLLFIFAIGGLILGFFAAVLMNHDKPPFERCIGRAVLASLFLYAAFCSLYIYAFVRDYLDETRKPPSTPEV